MEWIPKEKGLNISALFVYHLKINQTTPCPSIASATFRKPAIFAPLA